MNCSLCGVHFSTHEQTYRSNMLPDENTKGMWKKGFRTGVPDRGHDLCIACLEFIQGAIRTCRAKKENNILTEISIKSGEVSVSLDMLDEMMEDAQTSVAEEGMIIDGDEVL